MPIRRLLSDPALVVAWVRNEDLLGWALTPGGSLYILLGGGLVLAVRVQDELSILSATARLLLQVRRFVVEADLPAASAVEGREREAPDGDAGPPSRRHKP